MSKKMTAAEWMQALAEDGSLADTINEAMDAEARVRELEGELERLRELIKRDGTGLANALDRIRKTLRGYSWLGEPDVWGSYSYEDQTEGTLRKEMASMLDDIEKVARDAMLESGDRVNAAFRSDRDLIAAAHKERDEARTAADRLTAMVARVKAGATDLKERLLAGCNYNRAAGVQDVIDLLDSPVEPVRVTVLAESDFQSATIYYPDHVGAGKLDRHLMKKLDVLDRHRRVVLLIPVGKE